MIGDMKPQDVLILLKVFFWQSRRWSQRELAEALSLSLSEVNHGLKRLESARLYNPIRKGIFRQNAVGFSGKNAVLTRVAKRLRQSPTELDMKEEK